jgi:hypothetical protein
MEKEKPYKCEVCGKRYKNLNGLKYVSNRDLSVTDLRLIPTSTSNIHPLAIRNSSSTTIWQQLA